MNRHRAVAAVVLPLLVAGARTAAAQPLAVCTPTAVKSCASFLVTTTPLIIGGVDVLQVGVQVRNLQGSSASDNTGGSSIYAIALGAQGISMFGPPVTFDVAVLGTASQAGAPQWGWFENYPLSVFMEVPFGAKGAITGCQTNGLFDASGADAAYYRTCGGSGAVQFTFNTPATWTPADLQIGFEAQSLNGDIVSCVTRGQLSAADVGGPYPWSDTCVPPSVNATVPEPATVVLFGGGLLGLGLTGARQRRRASVD